MLYVAEPPNQPTMTPVLSLSLLPAGHTHQLDHGEYKVLLTNVDGEVYAVESKCSHFNLPLENAALDGYVLRCPFHHACFDVRDGKQLEAPGLDGIAHFSASVTDGQIYLPDHPTAPSLPIAKPAAAVNTQHADNQHFDYAIVGGGIAAANAVYGIREYDADGSIVLITSEDLPPYDRTHVSKALLDGGKDVGDLPLHSEAFYKERGVTLLESTVVERLDVQAKSIGRQRGMITYGKVLLATGGRPIELSSEGADLDGIYTIRSAHDGRLIREKVSEGTKVVVIGGSFIGLEVAMSLGKQGGDVTVVAPEEVLFEDVFGQRVGKWIQSLHEEAGVTFRLGRKSDSFNGKGGVDTVMLDNGDELPAEVVVIGIGVEPATGYLARLATDDDGGISVDNHLRANAAGVYAAGDIARYPGREGAVRIEHWKVAAQQGRVAGRNMAGHEEPYTMLPYFWSNQQGTNLRYAGHGDDFDKVLFDGSPGDGPFLAFYVKGEHLQAVLGVKRDHETAVIANRMVAGTLPANDELVGYDWR